LNESKMQDVAARKLFLHMRGTVDYQDIFGEFHVTPFRYLWNGNLDNPSWETCPLNGFRLFTKTTEKCPKPAAVVAPFRHPGSPLRVERRRELRSRRRRRISNANKEVELRGQAQGLLFTAAITEQQKAMLGRSQGKGSSPFFVARSEDFHGLMRPLTGERSMPYTED
jgi:hypothetical protein